MVVERWREIEGRRQRWLEVGEARANNVIVWLHAFPVTSDLWRPQLETPRSGWRQLAPDLAGFGGSDDHRGPPTIEDFAGDVDSLLDELSCGGVVIGGLSMGGYAAFAQLRVAPERIRGLILADTRAGADSPEARAGRETLLATIADRGPTGVADAMLPKLLGETTRTRRPTVCAEVRRLIERQTAEGLRRAVVRLRDRPDAERQLRGIAVPTLVIVGEEDEVTPVAEARRLAAAIPGAALATIAEAGHLSNLENPDSFNAAVAPWLAGL
jgi:3-oxoadipate enol-lactonase